MTTPKDSSSGFASRISAFHVAKLDNLPHERCFCTLFVNGPNQFATDVRIMEDGVDVDESPEVLILRLALIPLICGIPTRNRVFRISDWSSKTEIRHVDGNSTTRRLR